MYTTKKIAVFLAAIFLFLLSFTFSTAVTSSSQLELSALDITSFQASLNWTTSPGTWKYNIYRASSEEPDFKILKTTSVPYFTDSGLKPSAAYWYYIRAYSTDKSIIYSNHIKIDTKTSKNVLGFTTRYNKNDISSYNSLLNNTDMIDQIATYTYTTDSLGNLTGNPPTDEIGYASSKGITPFALVTNNFSGNVAKSLLESRTNRQTLIDNILKVLKSNNYKGVNIDIEAVYASNRNQFTQFMDELYTALKPQGFMVTVDIPAKTWDDPNNGWAGAYDYSKLSNCADQIIIMTYDEHYSGGSPGPIASIGWVEKVVDYALTVIPQNKIMLGTAAYGYDWSSKGTKAYGIEGIKKLSETYNKPIEWDSASKTPYFNYVDSSGIQHSVWFENSTSLSYKLNIVNTKNLRGIAIWKLGLENQDYWTTIKEKFGR